MNKQAAESFAVIATSIGIAAAIAWAGAQGGSTTLGIPLFALGVAFAFLVQWVVFVPAFAFQTERYYDLTGSATYLAVVTGALLLAGNFDARSLLLFTLISIWALRLGSFLYGRIRAQGGDTRFDSIKPSFPRFLMAWTLQGLWVSVTLASALAAITATEPTDFGALGSVGAAIWAIGFTIEVISDRQKRIFREDRSNAGRYISSGFWSWSRHPNYLGEIILWSGIAVIAVPALTGWQIITLVSPVFVFVLIRYVSGIPPLEARADDRWKDDPTYQEYKERTPVLFPRFRQKRRVLT